MAVSIDLHADEPSIVLRCDIQPASPNPREWDTCLLNVGGDLMRGCHKLRFRQFRRCVVPLRLALDVKRQRTNDKAHDGNLTAQALAEIVIREQADPCADFRSSRPLPYPPSPRGHAIPDVCLTPKVLGQRPQARPHAWAGVFV
jgi:hypothetical protein